LQQVELLSGRLSDPSKLLDADDRLRAEEERLAPTTGEHAVTVQIQPYVLCARCRAEVQAEARSPVVELAIPPVVAVAGAPAKGGVCDSAEPETRMEDGPTANGAPSDAAANTGTRRSGNNVVALKQPRSIHDGPYSCARTDVSRDPNVGSFRQDASARDPHAVDLKWPEPTK
jgi:hypothetical protein